MRCNGKADIMFKKFNLHICLSAIGVGHFKAGNITGEADVCAALCIIQGAASFAKANSRNGVHICNGRAVRAIKAVAEPIFGYPYGVVLCCNGYRTIVVGYGCPPLGEYWQV